MIIVQTCTQQDVPVLARMNLHLWQDEEDPAPVDLPMLEKRMMGFLQAGMNAFFFVEKGGQAPVGYALCDTAKSPVYLKHFFIERAKRRHGYGRQAFHTLLAHLGAETMDLDVYLWNERGLGFWKSLGFAPRCYIMRYEGENKR